MRHFLRYSKMVMALLFSAAASTTVVHGQESRSSDLYRILKNRDSLIFNVGFNQCNLSPYDSLISEDLEFYHDKAGATYGKTAFIASVQKNICNGSVQAKRELTDSSLKIFPLYNQGILYAAIQEGVHLFYIKEPDGWKLTGTAAFTHLWLSDNGHWKLKRVLSYDHH